MSVAARRPWASHAIFAAGVLLLVALRYALVDGFHLHATFIPHDDQLYIKRAYWLLTDGTLGPLDARTFVKLPGYSFYLAALGALGVPYLSFMFFLHVGSGLYAATALRGRGPGDAVILAAFGLFLFNPATLDMDYFRAMREPLNVALMTLGVGASLRLVLSARERRRDLVALAILAVAVAVMPLVREDDVLVLVLPVLAAAACSWFAPGIGWRRCLVVALVPLAVAGAANAGMRAWIGQVYGVPLLHDFSEGAFPELVATLRAVESGRDNRHVMISQETLGKVFAQVPEMQGTISRIAKPGTGSYSCQRFRVCSEWTNGYFPFWLKDAVFDAAPSSDLLGSQARLRQLSARIREACGDGRLSCNEPRGGLIPRMELKWTRVLLQELVGTVRMTLRPEYGSPGSIPQSPLDHETTQMYVTVIHGSLDPAFVPSTSMKAGVAASDPQAGRRDLIRRIAKLYRAFAWMVAVAGLAGFLYVVYAGGPRRAASGETVLASIVVPLVCLKVAALTYVSVYMGYLDPRVFASSHCLLLLLGLPMAQGAIAVYRADASALRNRRAA